MYYVLLLLVGLPVIVLPLALAWEFSQHLLSDNTHITSLEVFLRHGLPKYILNSLKLVSLTLLVAVPIAVTCAWSVSMYQFPFRTLLSRLLVLPVAIPLYVSTYSYNELLGQFSIHKLWLGVLVCAFSLYPYIYVMCLHSFRKDAKFFLEVGQTLNYSRLRALLVIILPLSKWAVVLGMAFVSLEILAEYGAFVYLGIHTLSLGLVEMWNIHDNKLAALLMAMLIMGVVMLCLYALRKYHKTAFSSAQNVSLSTHANFSLPPTQAISLTLLCSIPCLLGFFLPTTYLLYATINSWRLIPLDSFLISLSNSLLLALSVSLFITSSAFFLTVKQTTYPKLRNSLHSSPLPFSFLIAFLNYALPGVTLAFSVLYLSKFVDFSLFSLQNLLSINNVFIHGTQIVLLYALIVRFMPIGLGLLSSSRSKINPRLVEAAKLSSLGRQHIFWYIKLPLLREACILTFLLTFVETFKELPISLLLRPFDYETVATKLHHFAADELFMRGAPYGLCIVLVSTCAVVFFPRLMGNNHQFY